MIRRYSASALIMASIALCLVRAQEPEVNGVSLTTKDRRDDSGWWPTKGDAPRTDYAGSESCKSCHGKIAATQETTSMYHAGIRAADSPILKAEPQLTYQDSGFNYSLTRGDSEVTFSATDGTQKNTAKLVWAFGAGVYGQTYIVEQNGVLSESRLSYFTKIHSLGVTPGQGGTTPEVVDEALGKKLYRGEAEDCFQCHTTEAVTARALDWENAIPGVTCESCHGPGAQHVAAMRNENYDQGAATIMNPKKLSASDLVDFCGACHRTTADVLVDNPENMGAMKVRFQPYRLEMSRCWKDAGDARITCIACHDPHEPLVKDVTAYDSKCLACHSPENASTTRVAAKTCKVGVSGCVQCHMPKVTMPEANTAFTDHYIRVVSANDAGELRLGERLTTH